MTLYSFKEFLDNLVQESLHPELKEIASKSVGAYGKSKQSQLAKKIKDLTAKGEETGLEGNMPKGSSRAYLPIKERVPVTIDGKKSSMPTGLKVSIRASLDKHHKKEKYDGMSLGAMQNESENGDYFLNSNYRILTESGKNSYSTNKESGVFPPIIDHDHENHEWSHVGHVDNLTRKNFKELTKTDTHPDGISHDDFVDTLHRDWDRSHGKHWGYSDEKESRLDHVEKHPLVQKFLDHQLTFSAPPHDYRQIKNMGIWTHPVDGSQHIVARDHGFSNQVMNAYRDARKNMR